MLVSRLIIRWKTCNRRSRRLKPVPPELIPPQRTGLQKTWTEARIRTRTYRLEMLFNRLSVIRRGSIAFPFMKAPQQMHILRMMKLLMTLRMALLVPDTISMRTKTRATAINPEVGVLEEASA